MHGLHQESPRVVELEMGIHHGYLNDTMDVPEW